MVLKIVQSLVGILIGWFYFYFTFTLLDQRNLLNDFYRAHEVWAWVLVLTIPFLLGIASFRYRLIRWGLLSFSLVVFLLVGFLGFAFYHGKWLP